MIIASSGVGPAAPPAPAMTSPAWISVKPRSVANQALEARMWQRTPAQLRNSQRDEKWLVAVELTQTRTKRVLLGPHRID